MGLVHLSEQCMQPSPVVDMMLVQKLRHCFAV